MVLRDASASKDTNITIIEILQELKTQALSKSWSGRTQLGRGGSRGKVKGDNNENASLSAASLCLLLQYSVFYSILLLVQLQYSTACASCYSIQYSTVFFGLYLCYSACACAFPSCYSTDGYAWCILLQYSVFYSLCLLLW